MHSGQIESRRQRAIRCHRPHQLLYLQILYEDMLKQIEEIDSISHKNLLCIWLDHAIGQAIVRGRAEERNNTIAWNTIQTDDTKNDSIVAKAKYSCHWHQQQQARATRCLERSPLDPDKLQSYREITWIITLQKIIRAPVNDQLPSYLDVDPPYPSQNLTFEWSWFCPLT